MLSFSLLLILVLAEPSPDPAPVAAAVAGTPVEGSRVAAVAMTRDGARLAVGGRDKAILVHRVVEVSDTADSQFKTAVQHRLEGHKEPVAALAFDPNGGVLASAAGDTVYLWRMSDGKKSPPLNHDGDVVALAFTPDGDRLVTGLKSGRCAVWEVAGVKPVLPILGHTRAVSAIAFIDDKYFLTSAEEAAIKLWSIDNSTAFLPMSEHKGGVASLAVAPQRRRIVSGGTDRVAVLWEIKGEGKDRRIDPARRFTGHRGEVMFVSIGPDPDTVVSASRDKTLQQWDIKLDDGKQPKLWTNVALEAPIIAGATDSTRSRFLLLDGSGQATLYSAVGLGLLVTDDATATASSPLFRKPLLPLVYRWDEATQQNEESCVAVSSKGKLAVTLSDGRLEVRDALSPTANTVSLTVAGKATSVAFTPAGDVVVVGRSDGNITTFDPLTGRQAKQLKGHAQSVRAIVFTPNGQRLLTASDDKNIHLWNVASGDILGTFLGHTASVRAVAVDPQLTCVATGSDDKTVRVWNAENYKTIQTLTAHTGSVTAVAFTPDGQRLLTASDDTTLIIWKKNDQAATSTAASTTTSAAAGSPEYWKKERTLTEFTGEISSLAFTPDGGRLLVGSREGLVAEMTTSDWRVQRVGVARALPDPKYATIRTRHKPPEPPALPVVSLAVSADGQKCVTTGGAATVVWTLPAN